MCPIIRRVASIARRDERVGWCSMKEERRSEAKQMAEFAGTYNLIGAARIAQRGFDPPNQRLE